MEAYSNTPDYIDHALVQGITDDECEGELTPDLVFKDGLLVDRIWSCDCCGHSYREEVFFKMIEAAELYVTEEW